MEIRTVKGGLTHEGQKHERTREVEFPTTLAELTEQFDEGVIVRMFANDYRRNIAEDIRTDLKDELGIKELSAKDKAVIDSLKPVLQALGMDDSELRTVADYQNAVKEALGN